MTERRKAKLLLVDDDPEFLEEAVIRLSPEFICAKTADFGDAAELCQKEDPDVVLLDLLEQSTGEERGLQALTEIVDTCPRVPVVMWSEEERPRPHIEAKRRGAFWSVPKTAPAEHIGEVLEKALELRRVSLDSETALEEVDEGWGAFVYASDVMKRILADVSRIASTDRVVLITGERGVGKGLLAREIHRRSERHGPFVAVDCPALSPSLFRSDLFGHIKGAYTSADVARSGLCEKAGRGTLFLDEVGDIPRETQLQLRLLVDERVFRRVGCDRTRVLEARIIAATNRDLDALAERGDFKADLLDRMTEERIHIPPLRDRPEDVPVLARHFVAACAEEQKRDLEIAEDALFVLQQRKWEKNVRGLKQDVERACLMSEGPIVTALDFAPPVRVGSSASLDYREAKKQNEQEFKRAFAIRALARNGWNVTRAAAESSMARGSLHRVMRELGIQQPE
ncbi:MAG: sigma-54 dependent transcriptional regulator [Candidatus Eisenbacteria bacterium]